MVKKHLWTITEGTKFAHCIELKCIQGNYTNVSLNTFLRDEKVNCTGPKTIEVNASDASTRENNTLIWIKTCKYNNYMWKKNTRLIMKLKKLNPIWKQKRIYRHKRKKIPYHDRTIQKLVDTESCEMAVDRPLRRDFRKIGA